MSNNNDECLSFIVEWFDPMPMLIRKYLLKYYVEMHQVEMIDIKNKKQFLKKSPCPPEVSASDFFIGSKIYLYCRELNIVDYGDSKTKAKFNYVLQPAVVILTQSSYQQWGRIFQLLNNELNLIKLKSILVSATAGNSICEVLNLNPRQALKEFTDGVTVVVLFQGEDAFTKIGHIIQQESTNNKQPLFYSASTHAQSSELQRQLLDASSSSSHPSSVTYDSCTCCVVKPHATKDKQFGLILDHIIAQGYEVSAMKSIQFEKAQAEEFLEVYKGVIPTFNDHVTQFCLGTSIALEVRAQEAVQTFRETAGPWDVDMAKELRPDTIRGKYGYDNIRSAIHCSDLPQDGVIDCEYCFKLIN